MWQFYNKKTTEVIHNCSTILVIPYPCERLREFEQNKCFKHKETSEYFFATEHYNTEHFYRRALEPTDAGMSTIKF